MDPVGLTRGICDACHRRGQGRWFTLGIDPLPVGVG